MKNILKTITRGNGYFKGITLKIYQLNNFPETSNSTQILIKGLEEIYQRLTLLGNIGICFLRRCDENNKTNILNIGIYNKTQKCTPYSNFHTISIKIEPDKIQRLNRANDYTFTLLEQIILSEEIRLFLETPNPAIYIHSWPILNTQLPLEQPLNSYSK